MPFDSPLSSSMQVLMDVKGIQSRAASKHGALVVSTFSQTVEPVASFLKLHPKTRDGICQQLVACWIAAHAAGGSLWNTLFDTIHGVPRIRLDQMRQILSLACMNHAEGEEQDLKTAGWLRSQGVLLRGAMYNARPRFEIGGQIVKGAPVVDPALGMRILRALPLCRGWGRGGGAYVLIGVYRPDGAGHAIGAWLGGAGGTGGMPFSDVALFDPNYGEFWFEKAASFAGFFKELMETEYKGHAVWTLHGYGARAF